MAKKRGQNEGSIYQDKACRWRGAITVGFQPNKSGQMVQKRKVLSGHPRVSKCPRK